ncbi:MAG: alpha-ketoglutarate-dependent dioxygenase AlkB [Myxococcota bacterium]
MEARTIPGILYLEGFLPKPGPLFDWAVQAVAWDDRIRARKTASFGVPYNYAGLTYPPLPFPPALEAVRSAVSQRLGHAYNNCLLNYYPDGRARMGFHSDSAEGIVEEAGVAIVSLGAVRALRFRRSAQLDDRLDYVLGTGSLLFMASEVQREWQHALPRTSRPEPRISLTFRAVRGTAPE